MISDDLLRTYIVCPHPGPKRIQHLGSVVSCIGIDIVDLSLEVASTSVLEESAKRYVGRRFERITSSTKAGAVAICNVSFLRPEPDPLSEEPMRDEPGCSLKFTLRLL